MLPAQIAVTTPMTIVAVLSFIELPERFDVVLSLRLLASVLWRVAAPVWSGVAQPARARLRRVRTGQAALRSCEAAALRSRAQYWSMWTPKIRAVDTAGVPAPTLSVRAALTAEA